jgi:hypothetical protein
MATTQAAPQITRLAQVQSLADFVDYFHSSPAALAALITVLVASIAYFAKPAVDRWREAGQRTRRIKRLLQNLASDILQTRQNLNSNFDKAAYLAPFLQEERYIPYHSVANTDVLKPHILAVLPDIDEPISSLVRRYYANDALMTEYLKDYRTDHYASLTQERKTTVARAFLNIVRDQIETCDKLIEVLPTSKTIVKQVAATAS